MVLKRTIPTTGVFGRWNELPTGINTESVALTAKVAPVVTALLPMVTTFDDVLTNNMLAEFNACEYKLPTTKLPQLLTAIISLVLVTSNAAIKLLVELSQPMNAEYSWSV